MKEKIVIKQQSIDSFLKDFQCGYHPEKDRFALAAHLPEIIYLKKSCGLIPGETLDLLIDDMSSSSRVPLSSAITYEVKEYDSYSFQLIEIEVKVAQVE